MLRYEIDQEAWKSVPRFQSKERLRPVQGFQDGSGKTVNRMRPSGLTLSKITEERERATIWASVGVTRAHNYGTEEK